MAQTSLDKLRILADAAKYDASCASSGAQKRTAKPGGIGSTTGSGICHSYTPDGRCVSLLKILLTNYCLFDCAYCVNRRSSNVGRARFSAVADGEHFVAWFEPDHFIVGLAAPFFVDRFRSMRWSILTPVGSLHWDGAALAIGPPAERRDAASGDSFEESWRSYYESAFNPARVNPAMMQAEMPKRYWRNLPEASLIRGLVRSAGSRVGEMTDRAAMPPAKRNPEKAVAAMSDQEPRTLEALNRLISAAEPMVPGATRAVLGEGPLGADIAFVGEQPGDQEDLEGRPFVGPAGALLDRAMQQVGIDRTKVYVTNAVKHFKFQQCGIKPEAWHLQRAAIGRISRRVVPVPSP